MGKLPKLSSNDWKKVIEAKGYLKKHIIDDIYKKYEFDYIDYVMKKKEKKTLEKEYKKKKQTDLF